MTRVAAAPAVLRGLVLAGGRSERLGRDKASVKIGATTLLEHAVDVLSRVVDDVRVAVRGDQLGDALRGRFPLLVDVERGIGPAAGLLAAHEADPAAAWLVLACDMPGVGPEILRQLVAARDPAREATAFRAPADGLPEPLCAIYEPVTLQRLRGMVNAGSVPSPRALLAASNTVLLDAPDAEALGSINTPADLPRLAGR